MKSVLLRNGRIELDDTPKPEPGPGEVLVRSRACGICGSDLHMVHNAGDFAHIAEHVGMPLPDDFELEIALGHEFVGEIAAFGPETQRQLPVGQRVCSMPFLPTAGANRAIGAEPGVPGAYSEYFLCNESLLIPIADHVSDEAAALVEPLAVGIHAVARSGHDGQQAALVLGCGPIGLAVITALRSAGVETIVAADPVESRRELASASGATHIVDSAGGEEMDRINEHAAGQPVVIYECVGRPFMLSQIIDRAPQQATCVFVGLCTEDVSILPFIAMQKELDLKFAFYYAPEDFMAAVETIAAGGLDASLWVTGKVGIDGVSEAFEVLSAPNEHVKVLVEPWREGGLEARDE